MKQDEIDRCLVLFYTSTNNAMDVNYTACCERIDRLCVSMRARDELVNALRKMADDIQRNYPSKKIMFKEVAKANECATAWRQLHFERNKQYGGEAYAKDIDIQGILGMHGEGNESNR